MVIVIATAVLWLAAVSRIVTSIRRPDPARSSMTVAVVCAAAGLTLYPTLAGHWFDAMLGWPYGSELLQHLLWAGATLATLRFMALLRRDAVTQRWHITQLTVFTLVVLAMIGFFVAVPTDPTATGRFVVEYADSGAAIGYRAVFESYLVYCLVSIVAICRRNLAARHRSRQPDPTEVATAVSLSAIAAAAAVGTVAACCGLAAMVTQYLAGHEAMWLNTINTVTVAIASVLLGVGILLPVPAERFLRWRRARRTAKHLAALWNDLTTAVPQVVLPIPATRSPVSRAELVSARRRIEIADALHRIRITDPAAATIRGCNDPSAALGRTLRNRSTWDAASSRGVVAADLLTAAPARSDLERIWTVAAAYAQ